jgi:hypothetical protein
MPRHSRQDVIDRACRLGLTCDYYGPGDGLTRYRFFAVPMDYFAGKGLGTCLGAKESMTWLDGYEAGKGE